MVFAIFLIIFGIIGVISSLYGFNKTAKETLLKEMYNNGDINEKAYIKWTKKL